MEKFQLEKNIRVFCIQAVSFPQGVEAAHQQLHSLIPFSEERNYFGLSRPNEKGIITYFAAAEETEAGEGRKFSCETILIRKGEYISQTIQNYRQNIPQIGETFQQLLHSGHPLAHDGYCVEWYLSNTEMRCMVLLNSN